MGKLIDAIKKDKKERAEQEKKQKAASLTPQLPSYFNVLAKNNDKYGLSAAREEKSFDVQPTRKLGLIEQIKREKTSANADSIIDRLNTWYKNSNNFMSNYQTRFSGLTGTYNDPYDSGISDWLSTVTEQKSRFDAEADSILSYLTANSDLFDEEWLNATITNLNFTRKQQEDILKNTENINKHWSQFADENEYLGYQNEYQKQKRYEGYQSKYEGKSYEDIVSALGTMQDGEEKDWLKNESLMRYDLDAGQEEIGRLTSILDVKNQITAIKQEESTLKLAIAKGDKNAAEKLAKNNQRLEALNSTWEHALSTYGSEDNLNSLLSSKRAEYTTAERAQKAAELALVADETSEVYDPKFSTYSELGKHISYENVGSTKNQNGIAIYDDLKAATLALNEHQLGTELYTEDMMLPGDGISGYLQGLKGISEYNSENNDTVKTFRKMNESEFAILAYYLKKDEENGTDLAAQYIASIKQTLNTRVAMDIAKEKEGNLALQYVFAVEAGLDQFYEGRDAWRSGEDSIVPSATQIASGIIREDLAETGAKLPDWLGGASLGQVGYDAITTTSNMLPSILVSTVGNAALPGVGTIAGAGVLGMSVGGNAKAEMLRLGYSEDQATSYGLMVGIAEAGMEYLLGHIPGLSKGDGLFSTLGTKVASKVDNAISRVAISLGDKGTDILKAAASRAIGAVGGALDEALEEGLQTIIEPWLKEVATSVDWEDPKVDEVLYSSLLGAITSFGFSAGETVIDGVRYPAVQNAEAKKNLGAYQGEIASEVVALNPNDSFAKNMQAKVESGKDLSGSQLNRLVKNYESTLTQNDVEKIKSATVNRLNELGESGDVEVIASALTKQATGKKLSSKEQKVIESSTFGQRVANELNPENIKSRGYTSAWAENIGTDRINVKEYNKDLMESEDAPTRVTVGGKTAAAVVLKNAEGKTVRAEIQGVEADGDKATFTLSNGETVASDKVAFKSEDAKLVADTATERVSRVEGFTNETATAMIKGYDGSVSAAKYITLFDEAYNMGATDKPSSALVKVMNLGISESVAHTAYVLGKESSKNAESILNSEAKNGIINNNINESEAGYESGENLHLRNSGEWAGGQNTEGQVSRMEGSSGQAESRGEIRRIVADSEAARLVNEGREVKVADLGILGGSNVHTVRLVDQANETSSMKEARKNAEARGLKVKFFVGDSLTIKDKNGHWFAANAYIKGEHVLVRADHSKYTSDQLMRHELGHDMIAKGEFDIDAVRERLIETVGKDKIDEVAKAYSDAYVGSGLSAEEIWEECICDSLGDMNIFAGNNIVNDILMEGMLPEINKAANETKSPTQTRGSPEGKASWERHELYTATKAFAREVAPGARSDFARSLANKTSDMAEGEIRTLYVVGYIFEADGYMHGHMLAPYNEKTKKLLEGNRIANERFNEDRETVDLWSQAVQNAERRGGGDIDVSRRGRSGADDRLLGTSSERDTSGNNERVRETFETKEETERILSQLKKLYGIEEADEASKYSSPEEAKASRELDFLDFMEQQTDREVLANAFESVAQNDVEKAKLKDYRENINRLNTEEEKLVKLRAEIKELSFAKGARDITKIAELRQEAEKTANRIGIYDKRLLTLEASKPLRAVLEREKQKSYNRAKAEARADLDAYRARALVKQEELKTRYQESKARGVEGRKKTEVRHKIHGVVGELNTLLLNPTAKKHIKEELRRGVAEALSAFNMDTVGAEERLAEINRKLQKETDPYEIEHLLETYRRIQNQGDNLKEKLEKLKTAYENIKDSDDIELNLAYQEVIQNSIKAVSEKVGDTSIRDMTLEQLEMVYDLFKMIRHTIRDANKAFKTKKGETITQMAEAVNDQVRTVAGQPYQRNLVNATLQRMGWTFLKPYVAFRTIGSDTLVNRYRELREGEDTFYSDIREAQTFIEEQYEKYGFKSWDMKETREFKAKSGKSFELTLEQMMTLYAYSKREQAHAHIMEGGIVFEDALVVKKNKLGVPVKYEVTTKDAFNLSQETFADIANALTDKQKAFVDAMQEYLSTTMGAKGNDVSMQLLGVKLFKEKFYLPIKSSQYYMNFKAEEAGEVKLRSPAFSKETVHHANNPIVLHNFTDLWAEHINDMSMYHSFVLALEDFTRVYNYKTRTDANVETMDTKATLETAYPGVTKYINKFLKDMNGGVRGETVGWAERMTSLAKKGAVLGSASVAIQQPSAVMRAMAYINPKYFVGEKVSEGKHKEKWEELKKYAPIAGIKEMGRFDVGMGASTKDIILSEKHESNLKLLKRLDVKGLAENAKDFVIDSDYRDEIISLPPAKMDEVTWLAIWAAVKRETAHNYPKLATGSDAFKTLAGERFTDVISLSQVYDSVFSRSDLMRNKSWIAKSLTAFMAEPTTTLNMLWDSAVQGKRMGSAKGFVATTASTGGAVLAAIFTNSLLKSFVMAMRDDDEDESYAEKYLEHFVGDFKDNLNPLNLIPFVKDILSIFKGYDVERMDMALFSDLKNAIDAFDSDNKTLYEKWSGLIGAVAALRGVPFKNIERDVRALINTIFGKREETTFEGMLYAIEKGWTGEEKSDGQQLYEAMLKGDTKHIERVKARFEDQNAIEAAVYKALRDNDERITAAAEARYNGDIAEYMRIAKEIIAEGIFSQDNVVAAINSKMNALKKAEETDESEELTSDKAESIYRVEDFYKAIRGNDIATAYIVREDIINVAIDNGKSKKAAESEFEESVAKYVGNRYKEGLIGDADATRILTEFGGKTEDEASSKIRYWAFVAENPEYEDLTESAVNKYYDGYYKMEDEEEVLYCKSAQSFGITLDVYAEYVREKSGLTKKEDIMYIINTLPLTKEQKDALYYLNGWAKSTIREAPWR